MTVLRNSPGRTIAYWRVANSALRHAPFTLVSATRYVGNAATFLAAVRISATICYWL